MRREVFERLFEVRLAVQLAMERKWEKGLRRLLHEGVLKRRPGERWLLSGAVPGYASAKF